MPFWYCAPLGVGLLMFVAPMAVEELVPFLMVASIFVGVLAWIARLNRRAAACLDAAAWQQLTD